MVELLIRYEKQRTILMNCSKSFYLQVGTLPMAICAREMNKPLYVFAESFKFSLLYPLNQNDIPKEYKVF
jgi:translation initiation factor 2B subunit (eIF-2B alpha/beta/delta family)